jgi:hypothetical protein
MKEREVEYKLRVGKNVPDRMAWCTCFLFGSIMSAMNPVTDTADWPPEHFGPEKVNPCLLHNSPENKELVELMNNINSILLSVEVTEEKDVYLVILDLLKDDSPMLYLFPGEEDGVYRRFVWKYHLVSEHFSFEYKCDA